MSGLGDVRVPHVDEPHRRVARQPLAVGPHRGHRRLAVARRAEAVGTAGDDDAGGESLDVPLPGRRQRLVEVVGIEDEASLGRGEETEVGDVGVAAGLHDDVRARRASQVEGHHGGGAAVVGEGRLRHTRVAQREQLREPVGLLALEDGDGVTVGSQLERSVAPSRHPLAQQASLCHAYRWVDPGPGGPGIPGGRLGAQASSYVAGLLPWQPWSRPFWTGSCFE